MRESPSSLILNFGIRNQSFHSIHSSASDRSSMSSGSPDSSPLQHQVQPAQQIPTNISLSPASSASYNPSSVLSSNFNQLSYQQQSAARVRRSIPIVNPATGVTLSSPPTSISPGIMQASQRRWWSVAKLSPIRAGFFFLLLLAINWRGSGQLFALPVAWNTALAAIWFVWRYKRK